MRLGPCDDDVMFGPWAQWGQGFFGPYNIHYNLGLLHFPIHKKKKKKKKSKGVMSIMCGEYFVLNIILQL